MAHTHEKIDVRGLGAYEGTDYIETHSHDVVECVQTDDNEFKTLDQFVKEQRLRRVVDHPHGGPGLDPARRKGLYSVVVFRSGTVLRCFISGVSHSSYLVVSAANRGERRYEVHPQTVAEIYQ